MLLMGGDHKDLGLGWLLSPLTCIASGKAAHSWPSLVSVEEEMSALLAAHLCLQIPAHAQSQIPLGCRELSSFLV